MEEKSIGNMLLASLSGQCSKFVGNKFGDVKKYGTEKNVINMKLATLNGQSGKFVKCH